VGWVFVGALAERDFGVAVARRVFVGALAERDRGRLNERDPGLYLRQSVFFAMLS
jgi:hypothetical protein